MMRAVAELGLRHRRETYVSLEPIMGCGMGGCYSCVVPVRRDGTADAAAGRTTGNPAATMSAHFVRSCLEGPVFDASEIVWDQIVGGH
jgi:dihydroorotate dehydrogenase electron transfer subunit